MCCIDFMSRIIRYIEPVDSMSGKFAQMKDVRNAEGSNVICIMTFRKATLRKSYSIGVWGRNYATNPLSAAEQAGRSKFTQASQFAHNELKDVDKKQAAVLRWEAAGKPGTLFGFIFKEKYATL